MSRHSTNPWIVLVLICIAQFMVVLDATIVNVALPSIQKDLGFSEANLQWIINAYTLVFGGFLLLGGRAGRPARPQAALPDRPRDLHDRLAAERPRVDRGDADRLPRAPGPRRGADLARGALDHLDHVRRGRGARGARGLGRDRDRRRRDRPRARWRARRSTSRGRGSSSSTSRSGSSPSSSRSGSCPSRATSTRLRTTTSPVRSP